MPQASGTQGLHSIFEKSVSLTDDKGAFTVGNGTPREWVELGLPGRPRTDFAANFPPSPELSRCQYSLKLSETPIDTDSEPPTPRPPSFPWNLAAATRGVIPEH